MSHLSRLASSEELGEMARLRDRVAGYNELITRFFQPPIAPSEEWIRELLY